jgi:hypothetical protein
MPLERRLQPWCPGQCDVVASFVARYHKGNARLVFVATRHAFDESDPTMRAVDFGFGHIKPAVVIVEGFPTAMGENPPQLVEQSKQHSQTDAPSYTRGEGMHAAVQAIRLGVPFEGGEPTRLEEMTVLREHGYTDRDMAFSTLMGWVSQGVRSGEIPDATVEHLREPYAGWAASFRDQFGLEPLSLEDWLADYRKIFKVDVADDTQLHAHMNPGEDNPIGAQASIDMQTRDRHLLGLIDEQLKTRHNVLIVYGASHWTTLAGALERELGKPKIKVFR